MPDKNAYCFDNMNTLEISHTRESDIVRGLPHTHIYMYAKSYHRSLYRKHVMA